MVSNLLRKNWFFLPFVRLSHDSTMEKLNALLFLTAVALLFSCKPEDNSPIANVMPSAPPPEEVIDSMSFRYLALGDSYTIGESVDSDLRWPEQLVNQLESWMPFDTLHDPVFLATTGWTTSNLSNALSASGYEETTWDYVSLLIGVNNQYQGLSLDNYATEFSLLLQRAIACANGRADRVFVVSIPDYGYTPFGQGNQTQISQELEQFNTTCRTLTLNAGVAHFDITSISQQWPQIQGLVAADGLHPSALQYALWVDSFASEVKSLLRP